MPLAASIGDLTRRPARATIEVFPACPRARALHPGRPPHERRRFLRGRIVAWIHVEQVCAAAATEIRAREFVGPSCSRDRHTHAVRVLAW